MTPMISNLLKVILGLLIGTLCVSFLVAGVFLFTSQPGRDFIEKNLVDWLPYTLIPWMITAPIALAVGLPGTLLLKKMGRLNRCWITGIGAITGVAFIAALPFFDGSDLYTTLSLSEVVRLGEPFLVGAVIGGLAGFIASLIIVKQTDNPRKTPIPSSR